MQLTVLGSGGIFPNLSRGCAGYLLEHAGQNILLDLGPACLRSLLGLGIETQQIDGVCITHRHCDHTAELIWLIEIEYCRNRKRPLRLAGPDILQDYLAFYSSWGKEQPTRLPYEIIHTLMPGTTSWNAYNISAVPVRHLDHSVGYRIQVGQKSVVYPGDTGPCEQLVALAKNADVLILECSLPNTQHTSKHLNAQQAADIAHKAGVRKLILSHITPDVDVDLAIHTCHKQGIDTTIAHDGFTLTV